MLKLAKLFGKPEIFYSIQGEGKNVGQPSIFVRLSLCNLTCVWCDTAYTWNWENTSFEHNKKEKFKKDDWLIQLSDDELITKVKEFPCKNLIFTGGEPLVQHKDLSRVLKKLPSGYHIAFETNGTIVPTPELDNLTDQYNVSVKLSNSRVPEADRIVDKAIQFFASSPKANFKFVVDAESDVKEVVSLVERFTIPLHKVYLMPQGTTAEALKEKELWVLELCKKYGFNYTTRIHIQLYGDKKGV